MKKVRLIRILPLLALAGIMLLTGCSNTADTTTASPTSQTTATTAPAITSTPVTTTAEPVTTTPPPTTTTQLRTIVDDIGREVTLPENPQRVLALTKNMMDDLYELGIIVVGRVEEYKNRAELKALPSVSLQSTPDMEAIYQLKPDIIFANSRQHTQMEESLEVCGAAVIFLDPNKSGDDPLLGRASYVADILNCQDACQAYTARVDATCQELQAKIASAGYQTGLLMMGGSETISVAQPTGVYGALLPRLGIENIVPLGLPGSEKSTWVNFDAETIVQSNPDVILLKTSSNDAAANQEVLDAFLANEAWQGLKAVINQHVYILPSKVAPGNLSTEDILRTTAKIIYAAGFKTK